MHLRDMDSKNNNQHKTTFTELACIPQDKAAQKDYGAVGMVLNPLTRYTLIACRTEKQINIFAYGREIAISQHCVSLPIQTKKHS